MGPFGTQAAGVVEEQAARESSERMLRANTPKR